jgi:hypothetical protein
VRDQFTAIGCFETRFDLPPHVDAVHQLVPGAIVWKILHELDQ